MPGKVKVKILAGRNLPVMDRSSDTTDAFVEVGCFYFFLCTLSVLGVIENVFVGPPPV